METKKCIMTISHCILNQHAVVNGWERANGGFPVASYLLEKQIALLQLPCPEFLFLGIDRQPMSYEEYDNIEGYRQKCNQVLLPIVRQIVNCKESGYLYLGVLGINESPNCSIKGQRGVLMEEFLTLCEKNHLSVVGLDIPTWYNENNQGNFYHSIDNFIKRRVQHEEESN